ncbi:class I adenylate-forming enzyme family protein [Dactylosporangium sp. NPDC005572]|uniref:class I adenylate-forming enzyme family protein n=1 Tax=Dactylosporangium sp. NPDC005572 TaxID=3156889 RepID=UPI0033A84D4C
MPLDETSRLRILTAPGGPFPLTERVVDGIRLEMFDRDPRTMRDAFLATLAHGDRPAVVYGDERWTYAEQWDIVVALAHALRDDLGVVKGDHVGIAMRNYPEFVFAFWALELLGAVVVPFNGWLKTPELADLVAEARPTVLFADRERIALLRDVDLAASGVRRVVGVRCAANDGSFVDFADLLTGVGAFVEPPACTISPDDPSTLLFTSGTTGRPKGAVHTHRNHTASLLNKYIRAVRIIPSTDGGAPRVAPPAPSVKLVTFPFFHVAGLNTLYTAAYSGHALVLMYKWDAEEALRLIEAEGANELAGPPFVIQTFLAAAATTTRDLGSLRILGMGGSAAPVRLITQIADRFGTAVTPRTGYGMTETTSGVVSISAAEFAAHPDSVGRPLPTAEVALLGEDGQVLGQGEEGEIAIRGPQVVSGYYRMPDSEEFRDGWFRTGDLGRIDEDGLIYIVGRLKDIVIRGGENINCAEVEAALNAHPDVVEAAAFGAPHPTLGEELVAIVRVHDASTVEPDELRSFLADRLAGFKVPARIALSRSMLPRTPSGKIVKRDIAQQMQVAGILQPAGGG